MTDAENKESIEARKETPAPPISPKENGPVIEPEDASGKRSKCSRFFGVIGAVSTTLVSLALTGTMIGVVVLMQIYYIFSWDLPDSSHLANYQPAGMTRIYSKDGTLLAEYAEQYRIFVPYEEIPRDVINAFVAAEDKNFFQHRGVDPEGILRALLMNIDNHFNNKRSSNSSLVGGSTITQQVVKNFLLTNEQSLDRKIKEAILALRINQNYSKDRILELYLNEIYLGMGSYGVAAAGLSYFGKELHELSTEEIAVLAAMPKAPSAYDPRTDKGIRKIKQRRPYVLGRMYESGYINQAEYARAMAAPLEIRRTRYRRDIKAPYFTEEVRRQLQEDYGRDKLYKGNLYVKTTIDLDTQEKLDNAFRNAVRVYDKRHGYRGPVATIDSLEEWPEKLKQAEEGTPLYNGQQLGVVLKLNKDHAVLGFNTPSEQYEKTTEKTTYTGGILHISNMQWARKKRRSGKLGRIPSKPSDVLKKGDVVLVKPDAKRKKIWHLEQIPEVSGAMVAMRPDTGEVVAMTGGYSFELSKFNRATQAMRQPGSGFKPFVYMAALERGLTPSSIVVDAPITIEQGPGLPTWTPKNYGNAYSGPTTLRVGLEKSRNVMTVRLAQMITMEAIAHLSDRIGVYDALPDHLSNVLGAKETTVTRLSAAYATIANGGLKVNPTLIKRVDDNKGNTIYRADARICKHCNTDTGELKKRLGHPPILADERERVVDPRIAYQMVNILRGVVQRGTAIEAKSLGFDIAGKTGTTNDSRDAWFMGMSQDLVVGTYIGFDQPRGMGHKETGGRVALPAFKDFMKNYYGDTPPPAFIKPEGIIEIAVDRYTGVPPLPWQAPNGTVLETFVVGGSIYIPNDTIEYAEEQQENFTIDNYIDYGHTDHYEQQYYQQQQPSQRPELQRLPDEQEAYPSQQAIQPRSNQPYTTAPEESTTPYDNYIAVGEQQQSISPQRQERNFTPSHLPPRHPRHRRIQQQQRMQQQNAIDSGTGGIY